MKRLIFSLILLSVILTSNAQTIKSPDGKITIKENNIQYNGQNVLTIESPNFSGLKFRETFSESYNMLSGKKSYCINSANEYGFFLSDNTELILRVYNDGVAFRYCYHDIKNGKIPQEKTSFRISEGTKRWIGQWCESYEMFFPFSLTAKQKAVPSFSGTFLSKDGFNCRWAYPCLLETQDNVFVLLSEANISSYNSASSLWNDNNTEIFEVRPDKNDTDFSGDYFSPWRVAIIGELSTIVETTLITDLSEHQKIKDTDWIQPGVVSWIYWAYNHGSNDYEIIKKYVDLAVKLKLPYVLIDAEWDEMKNNKTIEDAVKYANDNNIKPLIWYNSSIGWIDGAPGPKFRLNDPEKREKEFSWCEKIGVSGVKIDFFSGDNQKNMSYCIDLLKSAAKYHLTVNFHGATIPRGWQRTYPNLLSTEGVYGAEWYNNVPTFTDKAASHNATLPFTRNVIGPMDYTPCAFSNSQHPHITSNAHELALTVLFESGLQHIADRPESLLSQPQEVQEFFSKLPASWDETRFVSGYPGKSAVLARRKGDIWYVAGINGLDQECELPLNLDFITKSQVIQAFYDSQKQNSWEINKELPKNVKCLPRGGFVLIIKQN